MTKLVVSSSALAFVLAVPAIAAAQSAPSGGGSSCPPGSWFCSTPPQEQALPAGKALEPLPDPDAPPPAPPVRRAPGVTYAPAPPVVVYQPPPPTMVVRPESPPPYEYAPPPPVHEYPVLHREPISRPHEWGLNLHLEGASIGHGSQNDASMGGLGAGLRFKPNRYFGIETDLDFVGGHGYSGDIRHETALTFNGLLFLNPKSRAQVYLLAGFGWSWAHSQSDPASTDSTFDNNYTYFGGQAGVGLELRLTRVLAFNVDLRGFVRSRTDQAAQYQPEFTDPSTGQQTNTSGGGLLTGGMTLYF